MKLSFTNNPYPVVTAIMSGETPEELIAECRNSEFDGADGIAIDLANYKPEFRNEEDLKRIIDSVKLPFMFYFYRNDKWSDDSTDEKRQELLLTAVDAGASIIDVMGDLYDPSPMELTHNKEAIDKQKKLIDRIHEKGADVVISSHMSCSRTTEEVIEHLKEVESRGADVVKIVTTADNEEELTEAFKTTMALKKALNKPFIHLLNGKFARPHRFMGPVFGVSIMFAVHAYNSKYAFTQPTIKSVKAVLNNIHWNINDVLE